MLEQWEADRLLAQRKVYSQTTIVEFTPDTHANYPLESDDGREFFILDIYRGRRNKQKARYQLRYERDIILARLCTSLTHQNPDGEIIGKPHLHRFSEQYGDKIAVQLEPYDDVTETLEEFCKIINLPIPDIQGGVV